MTAHTELPCTAVSSELFFTAPTAKTIRHPHFAYIGVSDELLSLLIWGHVSVRDVRDLIMILSHGSTQAKPRKALVQMQKLAGVEEEALRELSLFMKDTQERSRTVTVREAIIRPEGTLGMLVAGFYAVVPAHYPTAIFADRDEACHWLGASASERDVLVTTSEIVLRTAQHNPDLLYRLRENLAAHPTQNDIDLTASRLGTSGRTLQRRLKALDTSFEKEVAQARLSAAKNLLLRTNKVLKEIAYDVGLPSASRLSQLFAAHENMSPSEWRRLATVRLQHQKQIINHE